MSGFRHNWQGFRLFVPVRGQGSAHHAELVLRYWNSGLAGVELIFAGRYFLPLETAESV